MAIDLPTRARVVIVGGGVIGCSVAYHLTKLGWSDIVLLERKQLTSGTTWHAAGLVGQLRQSINMTQLARYTAELYRGLEAETGQATGYRQCGSLSLATTPGRMEELKRNASMAKVFGLPVNVVGPARDPRALPARQSRRCDRRHSHSERRLCQCRRYHAGARQGRPHARRADFSGPQGHRASITTASASAACRPSAARIDADYVVLCGGMWTRDLAASIGVTVPLHACEHYYVLFQDVPGLTPDMPVLRDYDHCSYFKYDAGKLLVGAFEPHARPWGADGIPEDFSFGEIAGDFGHFEPVLLDAMRRMPGAREGRHSEVLLRPGKLYAGRALSPRASRRNCENCFVAAGLNSIGLQSAGGIGKVVSEWIRDGHPPVDLWEVDVRRNMPFQINRKYLQARVSESLGLLYATHWPFRQYETARGVRKSALHDRLARGGRLLRRSLRLGARQLVRARRASQPALRVQLRAAELVRARAPTSTARCAAPSACSINPRSPNFASKARDADARAQSGVRQRRRRRAGQDGLHAVAQRARRHRGGSHRDAS